MPKPGVYRSPWRDFPDVVIQTTVTKLRSRPGYDQAKRGEGDAAYHVVQELIKPEKIPFEIDIIVPVTLTLLKPSFCSLAPPSLPQATSETASCP
jgi:hypothetical protein